MKIFTKTLRVRPKQREKKFLENLFNDIGDCGVILAGLEGRYYNAPLYDELAKVSQALEDICDVLAEKRWGKQK